MQTTGPPPMPPGPGFVPQPRWNGIPLGVSKRLLWIGEAAYPLHSIAKVYTAVIRPKRAEAVTLFLRRTAITAVSLFILKAATAAWAFAKGGGGTPGSLIALFALVAMAYNLAELLRVLSAQPCFVLTVETSGPSMGVVTSTDPGLLRDLVHRITHAIEHPEAEFTVTVEKLTVSPAYYQFGDQVNIIGGTGNVGMRYT